MIRKRRFRYNLARELVTDFGITRFDGGSEDYWFKTRFFVNQSHFGVSNSSLAISRCFRICWRGGLPDPINLDPNEFDPFGFPGTDKSGPVRLSSSSVDCVDILGQSSGPTFPYYRGWNFSFGLGFGSDYGLKVYIGIYFLFIFVILKKKGGAFLILFLKRVEISSRLQPVFVVFTIPSYYYYYIKFIFYLLYSNNYKIERVNILFA